MTPQRLREGIPGEKDYDALDADEVMRIMIRGDEERDFDAAASASEVS